MLSRFWTRLLLFACGAVLCVVGYLFLLNLPSISPKSPTAGVIPTFILALGTFTLTRWALRSDQLSFSALGLATDQPRGARFSLGFLAGTGLGLGWLLLVAITTGARWHLSPAVHASALIGAIGFHFFNNLAEEFVYRGYAFVRLTERFSSWLVIVSISGLFALLHWQGGLPFASALVGVFTSGLVFGATFARWRSLPLTLGVHLAMNVVQDASGLRPFAGSLFTVIYPSTATPTPAPLIAVGVLNTLVAILILVLPGRQRIGTNASNPDRPGSPVTASPSPAAPRT